MKAQQSKNGIKTTSHTTTLCPIVIVHDLEFGNC
jgi:hypothetical protein